MTKLVAIWPSDHHFLNNSLPFSKHCGRVTPSNPLSLPTPPWEIPSLDFSFVMGFRFNKLWYPSAINSIFIIFKMLSPSTITICSGLVMRKIVSVANGWCGISRIGVRVDKVGWKPVDLTIYSIINKIKCCLKAVQMHGRPFRTTKDPIRPSAVQNLFFLRAKIIDI